MAMPTVALREYIESRITHERELREEAAAAALRALELQAHEYERRLDVLNHSQARLDQAVGSTVPREIFDAYCKHMSEWREAITQQLAEQRGASNRTAAIVAFALAAFSLLLHFL